MGIVITVKYFENETGVKYTEEKGGLTLGPNAIILESAEWGIYNSVLKQPQIKLEEWK